MAHLTSSEVAFCLIHVHSSGVSHNASRVITAGRLELMKDFCSSVSASSFVSASGAFGVAALAGFCS